MRMWILAAGIFMAIAMAGAAGYQIAALAYTDDNQEREEQLQKEISLILASIADISDHRSRGESEIADWKFSQIHENLEAYVRAGGGPPSQFVYDIVETTDVPEEDDDEDEVEEDEDGE